MKERQRWRSEEDAILRAYVKRHGPREWHLVSQRMGSPLDRDAKSCLERWKNYLKPGIKKGSLTEQEQRLVISLQAKHGNKWKLIASEVPGRTAKRLGKWWEVFKDKESKKKFHDDLCHISTTSSSIQPGKYDRILENFAEKLMPHDVISPPPMQLPPPAWPPSPCVALTLGSAAAAASAAPCTVNSIGECCRELQEAHMELMAHRKEAGWRLKRVEIQLESEKAGKKREKMEEVEARIRALREEERMELERIEADYREQMGTSRKQVEAKEVKMVDQWAASHAKLGNLVGELGGRR